MEAQPLVNHPPREHGYILMGGRSYTTYTDPIKYMVKLNSCGTLIPLILAVAALWISEEFDLESSACADGTEYLIDLQTFLWVAGWVAVGHFFFAWSMQGCARLMRPAEGDLRCIDSALGVISSPVFLFNIGWGAIGLWMYAQQMSPQCREESIAKMILAWSVIMAIGFGSLALVACSCCCLAIR